MVILHVWQMNLLRLLPMSSLSCVKISLLFVSEREQ